DRPQLVERRDRRPRDVRQRLLELVDRDPDLPGDLLVRRRPPELRLERRDRALDLAGAGAHGARDPVECAQLVDDRAADAGDRVGLELDVAVGVVPLDRTDQAEEAVRDEVALVHVRGQPGAEPSGHVLDERRVHDDQPVAELLRPGPPVLAPEAAGVGVARHEGRIRGRAAQAFVRRVRLSAETANKPIHAAIAAAATAITQRPARAEPAAIPANASVSTVNRATSGTAAIMPSHYTAWREPRGVAQLAEHRSPKPGVAGSSPVAPVSVMRVRGLRVAVVLIALLAWPAAARAACPPPRHPPHVTQVTRPRWLPGMLITEYYPAPERWFPARLVRAPGLPGRHREGWLYSARGLAMQ